MRDAGRLHKEKPGAEGWRTQQEVLLSGPMPCFYGVSCHQVWTIKFWQFLDLCSSYFKGKGFWFSNCPNTRSIASLSSTHPHLVRGLASLTQLWEQTAFILDPYTTLKNSPDPPLQVYSDFCFLQNQRHLGIYGLCWGKHFYQRSIVIDSGFHQMATCTC